ncbi:uncharacterized protein LOC124950188 isoform X2 [Vespa velutina]|uniref:uncharacterized protein LOC124950188 isoform X2 n=1 Tax=Vespa velutina TaxID=202808 RepID=UPI001FB37EE0|nr:uncharacterized protein LOC124950188 isoform X2 [Vespa velutina]
MEKVEHLWNVTKYLTKLRCPEANRLQNFYIERCRNAANEVELPKKCFGPLIMCSHCGSLWATINHQVRILPGRKISHSVEIQMNKPKRKVETFDNTLEKSKILQKKKKKKGKDKTVGLNISGNLVPELQSNESKKIPLKSNTSQFKTKNLKTPKIKKLNINKMKDIVNQGMTPPNRKSLTNFLKELV